MSILPVHIEDVTAVAKLRTDIPVDKLFAEEEAKSYETESFPGAVYRVKEPKAVALIFSSGRVVCTGAKSVRDADEAMRKVLDRLRGLGVAVPKKVEVEIDKIVAAFRMKEGVDLAAVSKGLEGSRYEPERFPGIIYSTEEPRMDFIILSSGRIICTGARSIKDIQSSVKALKAKLEGAGARVELV